jgi:hypothetical protein
VLLAADGTVRVSDFGLAKPMRGQVFATSSVGVSPGCKLTRAPVLEADTIQDNVLRHSTLWRLYVAFSCKLQKRQRKPRSFVVRLLARKQTIGTSTSPVTCD